MGIQRVKRLVLFWIVGAAITVTIFCLSSLKPSVFGLFALPLWLLPAIAGRGAHDDNFLLGLLGASLFYAVVSFVVYHILTRRIGARGSK